MILHMIYVFAGFCDFALVSSKGKEVIADNILKYTSQYLIFPKQ